MYDKRSEWTLWGIKNFVTWYFESLSKKILRRQCKNDRCSEKSTHVICKSMYTGRKVNILVRRSFFFFDWIKGMIRRDSCNNLNNGPTHMAKNAVHLFIYSCVITWLFFSIKIKFWRLLTKSHGNLNFLYFHFQIFFFLYPP